MGTLTINIAMEVNEDEVKESFNRDVNQSARKFIAELESEYGITCKKASCFLATTN